MIRKAAPTFTADEMFQGKAPEEWRRLYAGAYYRGPDRGREIVEEWAGTFMTRTPAISFGLISTQRLGASRQAGACPRRLACGVHVEYRLIIVCPIASRIRPFPTSVVIPEGLPIVGEILLSNIRSLYTSARPIRYSGARLGPETTQLVRAKLAALITI